MVTQPRGGTGVSSKNDLVTFGQTKNGWTIKGKAYNNKGVMEISELVIRKDSKLRSGSLTTQVLKELNLNKILAIAQKSITENENYLKSMSVFNRIIDLYFASNYERTAIKFLKSSWVRRGNQVQPDLVYAKLSTAYVFSSLVHKNRGMATLAEKLDIPKRTLISRINSCYDFGFLERGSEGHFISIGKEDVRWTRKTYKTLGNSIEPIETVLNKIFTIGEKSKPKGKLR
jgi:predicted DNA-binding transcriptional regulator